jgi:Icc-related predicted phosphoesterase
MPGQAFENQDVIVYALSSREVQQMRIAATADLHFVPSSQTVLRDQLNQVRDEADMLVLAGDLTNYGQPTEMEPLLNAIVRLRVPTVAVLGNHDYESGLEQELMHMMTAAGIKVLDGNAYERDGVGFAGTKGFVGGFGRGGSHRFWRARNKDLRTGCDRRSA